MTSTFIRAAEVWVPSADGGLLEFRAGAFGAAKRFAAMSRTMCFGRGEGLPGRAWEQGRPLLLRSFEGSYFRRAAAAAAADLDCAVALPLYPRDEFASVLVFFCGHAAGSAAALELWHCNPSVSTDMTLVDGAYGPQGAAFESISHQTYLPRGVGLPGQAWQRGEAVFIEELAAAPNRFLRAEQAAEAGMQRGLAIPAGSPFHDLHVVTFLASPMLPLAQRIERWVPDESRSRLRRAYAFSELHGRRTTLEAELSLVPTHVDVAGSIVTAWIRGVPAINEHPVDEPGAPAAAAASIGAAALVAVPVIWEGEVAEVVALYL